MRFKYSDDDHGKRVVKYKIGDRITFKCKWLKESSIKHGIVLGYAEALNRSCIPSPNYYKVGTNITFESDTYENSVFVNKNTYHMYCKVNELELDKQYYREQRLNKLLG
jgi:hypothetical protein